jgi:hypothetical protein
MPIIPVVDEGAKLKFVKEFCGGFLERPRDHLWHDPTMKLSRDARMSIGMSLFLFRKVLPSTAPDLQAYLDKMSSESECHDDDFIKYVEKRVPELFPPGWDLTRYPQAALNATIPIKSCSQKGMGAGGARCQVLTRKVGWNDHQSYVMETLTRECPVELGPSRITAVETAGKYRVVSVGDVEMNLFRPLHTAIYNHLSSFTWLLRGDAKPSRFSEFTRRQGELFCSGDYESATDNLNSEVQQCILRKILENSASVPKGIKDSAPQMLRTSICLKGGPVVEQKRGQLMGNLLSFPLLCIVNYLAFRFYSKTKGPDVPVRVNGDDIIFRASQEVISRWMKGVKGSGLVLSKGKTMVDRTYFSLNSSLFKASEKRVSQVPFVRGKAIWGSVEDSHPVMSLSGRWRSFCVGYSGYRKRMWRELWLRQNRSTILASRRSLTRGLGLSVSKTNLIDSGLWDRECFYLSFPDGVEKPLPPHPALVEQQRIPEGWSIRPVDRITKEHRKLQKELGALFVQCAWSPLSVNENMKEKIQSWRHRAFGNSIRWEVNDRRSLLSKARLLGLSRRNAVRYLRPRVTEEQIRQIVSRNRLKLCLPTEKKRYDAVFSCIDNESPVSVEVSFSRCVRIREENCDLYWGPQQVRRYDCGRLEFGPPPTFSSGQVFMTNPVVAV